MSVHAGQTIAEAMQRVSWGRIREETLAGLENADRVDWHTGCDESIEAVQVPLAGLGQALRGLIQNGMDASAPDQRVQVEVSGTKPGVWTIAIRDRGGGMSRDTARRAGQPFFTTKPPGKGMGLGVFLADSLIRRLGGRMDVHSEHGTGTTVAIELPKRR
jgi:two-component system sensor histidine kinase RegB